jgi:hypothetical protein
VTRALAPLAAVAAAAAAGHAGEARADTLAFVRAGGAVFVSQPDGTRPIARIRGASGLAGVAFDRDGHLYVTRVSDRPGCNLFRAGVRRPLLRFRDIRATVRGETGLCEIVAGPRGGLLFDVTANAFPSERVWHVDPATARVRFVAYGFQPAPSPAGERLVVVRHRADYPTLLAGRPGAPGTFRPIAPVPRDPSKVGYGYPAFDASGQRIVAVRTTVEGGTVGSALLVGRPGGRLAPVWRVASPRRLGPVAWLGDGRSLLALVYETRRASIGALYRVPLGGGRPRPVVRDVTAFALRWS